MPPSWFIWARSCTTFSICAHILNTCIEHCVSSYCIDSLYSEPIYVTHATGSCITSSARHEHCEAPAVHTEDILGFYFEIAFSVSVGYMSVMSQRPCRIHQVWCSRSQLEWRAVVWAAWQRLLWKCEMSERDGRVCKWDLLWRLICQCPDRQQKMKMLEGYWRACGVTVTDWTIRTYIQRSCF